MSLFVSLTDEPVRSEDVDSYVLAAPQFSKYRPPTHRYLALSAGGFPAAAHWTPLTERLVVRDGTRRARAVLPTFTRPLAGRDADLDAWYTTWHLPEVLTVPGYAAGQRFARLDHGAPDVATRLALYELDATDLGAALDALQSALPAMHQTDALDRASIGSWCFVPLEHA